MIKYKVSGELKIELIKEGDFTPAGRIGYIYPIEFSGLGYSFEQFLNKKNELQNVIKEFIDKGID